MTETKKLIEFSNWGPVHLLKYATIRSIQHQPTDTCSFESMLDLDDLVNVSRSTGLILADLTHESLLNKLIVLHNLIFSQRTHKQQ